MKKQKTIFIWEYIPASFIFLGVYWYLNWNYGSSTFLASSLGLLVTSLVCLIPVYIHKRKNKFDWGLSLIIFWTALTWFIMLNIFSLFGKV